MNVIVIENRDAGQRLDKFAGRVLKKAPLGFIYKSFRNKDIRLNDKKASGNEILSSGDRVTFRFPDVQFADLTGAEETGKKPAAGEKIRLCDFCTILYEDDDILIVNKKAGVLSQQTAAGEITLNEALLSYCGGGDGLYTPSVCNRLDRNTTGIVTFARTYSGARLLNDAFKSRSSKKYYLAGVIGDLSGSFREKTHLMKAPSSNMVTIGEEGEEIETEWEDISHAFSGGTPVTLLRVRLITGKTHQIRAHLSAKGYPVIGDPKYGGHLAGFSHQLLHAYELYLPDGRVFRAPVPRKFQNLFIDFHETGVSG